MALILFRNLVHEQVEGLIGIGRVIFCLPLGSGFWMSSGQSGRVSQAFGLFLGLTNFALGSKIFEKIRHISAKFKN